MNTGEDKFAQTQAFSDDNVDQSNEDKEVGLEMNDVDQLAKEVGLEMNDHEELGLKAKLEKRDDSRLDLDSTTQV